MPRFMRTPLILLLEFINNSHNDAFTLCSPYPNSEDKGFSHHDIQQQLLTEQSSAIWDFMDESSSITLEFKILGGYAC